MRNYIYTALIAAVILLVYSLTNVRIFTLDIPRRINNSLFLVFKDGEPNDELVIFNTGQLETEEIERRVKWLLNSNPNRIGVIHCDGDLTSLKSNPKILLANCNEGNEGSLSRIIYDPNTVTHFRSNSPDCFEMKLTNTKNLIRERTNEIERINYTDRQYYPWYNLSELDSTFLVEGGLQELESKTFLVGYMREYFEEAQNDFAGCRITPMNEYFGHSYIPPDMTDTEISANIIDTLLKRDFITEIHQAWEILLVVLAGVINISLTIFLRTRWLILNLFIHLFAFMILLMGCTFLIVYLFTKNYFLELDALTPILILTTIFGAYTNIWEKRKVSGVPSERHV